MATANNTYKTRIQLKSDTETNWNKAGPKENSPGFVPLNGELIIYQADATHSYSRIKVGDGETNVVNLPFIDAGTLNGYDSCILKYSNLNAFPSPGQEDKLYLDLSSDTLYHYAPLTGYRQLFGVNVTKTAIREVVSFDQGTTTRAVVSNNTLYINNGTLPKLYTQQTQVVTNIT